MLTLLLLLLDIGWTQSGNCPWLVGILILVALPLAAYADWRIVANPAVSKISRWGVRAGTVFVLVYLTIGLVPLPSASMPTPLVTIDKSKHELYFKSQVYKIALSNRPNGTKQLAGDSRTPEGLYRICSKADDGPFGYWLGLDYPNLEDAWKARKSGNLSWLELTRWRWWWRSEPPQSTRLGGQVGLHGGGNHPNWTMGCIALDNTDIKSLYDQLPVGSVVEIRGLTGTP